MACTDIENDGREALSLPLLTDIEIFEYEPTSVVPGVPLSCPFAALKLAQDGILVIENVSPAPPEPLTVGVKE